MNIFPYKVLNKEFCPRRDAVTNVWIRFYKETLHNISSLSVLVTEHLSLGLGLVKVYIQVRHTLRSMVIELKINVSNLLR